MLSPQKAERGRLLLFLALTPGPRGAGGLGAAASRLSWARGHLPPGPPAASGGLEGAACACARGDALGAFLLTFLIYSFPKYFP